MKMKNTWLAGAAFIAAIPMADPALAQDTSAQPNLAARAAMPSEAADQSSAQLGEIVVTAQKREQRLNDVGITIATSSGAQLKAAGVTDVTQLARVVPGFSSAPTFTGFPVFSIRGINFNAGQLSAAPAVSVYLDEAPLPYSTMTGGLLLDVERVEVLKGPQGTLFGQNATGGSINVIAAKPTSHPSAGFSTEVNNYGQTQVQGFVSGPLSETLRVRVAISTTQFGAWQHGYYLAKNERNGDANRLAGRLLLDWTPTDRLTVSLNVNGNYDHGELEQPQPFLISPANPAAALPQLASYPIPTNAREAEFDPGFDTHAHNSGYQGVARIDYKLSDDIKLTSLTNYAHTSISNPIDLDGTALPIIQAPKYGGRISTITQEVRLTGTIPGSKINYIIGGNYQHDNITEIQDTLFEGYSGLPHGAEIFFRYKMTNRAIAGFGNADWEIVPGLTLTGGLRYTDTRQTINGCTFDGGNGVAAGTLGFLAGAISGDPSVSAAYVPGGCITVDNVPASPGAAPTYLPAIADMAQDQHNLSWRGGLNFKPTRDTLIYGLVSRGYKSGVFPANISLFESQINPLRQEKLTAYEVGTKLTLFDRKVQLNLAGFYYQYDDKQFYTYVPTPPIGALSTLINIPKSKAKGFDVDVSARPVAGLTLNGAMTYVKTSVGNYNGFDLNSQPVNFGGKEFNFAPPFSATFDAEYMVPVSPNLKAYIGGGGLHNDRTFSDLGESPRSLIRAYTIFDARVGVTSAKGWKAGLFVRNLTNKYYWNNIVTGGDLFNRIAGLPRTYGGSFSYQF